MASKQRATEAINYVSTTRVVVINTSKAKLEFQTLLASSRQSYISGAIVNWCAIR